MTDGKKRKPAPSRRGVRKKPPATRESDVLAEEISRLLETTGADLTDGVEALAVAHGDSSFVELLFLLAHLRFTPAEARRHWQKITALKKQMQERLGYVVDLRVALVSYFIDVSRQLKNPKVIELRLFEETQASAYRDELTSLHNYRYFREQLPREIERYERYGSALSLIMVDIDDFKHYNDQHGHQAGNETLIGVARLLEKAVRGPDIPVRYGGEEFALILPSTPKDLAAYVAERVRRSIEAHPFPHEALQPGGRLTVSLGVANCPGDAQDGDRLVRCADRALYVAKSRGKNRTYLYGQDRRSFRRVQIELEGSYCLVDAEFRPFTTVDVSEGSLFFVADQNLPAGTLMEITLPIPDGGKEISCSARVVRVEQLDDGRFRAAIRISEIAQEDRHRLVKFIQAQAPATE